MIYYINVMWKSLKKEQEEKKSATKIFPDKLSSQTIPDICHFFTRAKFLENKIYTEKRQFFALNL